MSEKSDVSAIIDDRLRRLQALSWGELDSFPRRDELIVGESGRRYRVRMWTFWDMEPWQSGLYLVVKVRPQRGPRRLFAYRAAVVRGGPDDPIPPPPSDAAVE